MVFGVPEKNEKMISARKLQNNITAVRILPPKVRLYITFGGFGGIRGALPPLTRCVCPTNAYLAISVQKCKSKVLK